MAFNRLKSKEVTEEILQDIFTSLWEKRSKTNIQNLSGYLYGAVKFGVLDYVRAQIIREKYRSEKNFFEDTASRTVEDQLTFEELQAVIAHEVNHLPDRCRLIFKMSREESLSRKEIAQQLNISPKTVDSQLNKAIAALRLQVEPYTLTVIAGMLLF